MRTRALDYWARVLTNWPMTESVSIPFSSRRFCMRPGKRTNTITKRYSHGAKWADSGDFRAGQCAGLPFHPPVQTEILGLGKSQSFIQPAGGIADFNVNADALAELVAFIQQLLQQRCTNALAPE